MKKFSTYIDLSNLLDKQLVEHLKIESNISALVFEKYGLFDGCEEIVSELVYEIINTYKQDKKDRFKIDLYADKFKNIQNLFFDRITLICNQFDSNSYAGGEYREDLSNGINKETKRLNRVCIEISFNYKNIRTLKRVLIHELTHAFDDFNRHLKGNVKTLTDIIGSTYVKAVNNMDGSYVKDEFTKPTEIISHYFYLCNSGEINAYISQFKNELSELDDKYDLTKENIVKLAYNIITNTYVYKDYIKLYSVITKLDNSESNEYKKEFEKAFMDITDTSKTYNAIIKEMKYKIVKVKKKLDSVIPKIVFDYIDKNTKTKVIEKLI